MSGSCCLKPGLAPNRCWVNSFASRPGQARIGALGGPAFLSANVHERYPTARLRGNDLRDLEQLGSREESPAGLP